MTDQLYTVDERIERTIAQLSEFLSGTDESAPILAVALGVAYNGLLAVVEDEGTLYHIDVVQATVDDYTSRVSVRVKR